MTTIQSVEERSVRPMEDTHHTTVLGSTRFYCIQPDCDGKRHVWCGCAH